MRIVILTPLVVLLSGSVAGRAVHDAATQQQPLREAETLDMWIERQVDISVDKLLANVAPGGRNMDDTVADGTVVASPSRQEPDYWYQWIRDAALSMSTLISIHETNTTTDADIPHILNAYTTLQQTLQHTANPSGTFTHALSSLGEPKFHVSGAPFTGSWGRPQRDGPALRALTLIRWAKAWNETNPHLWRSNSDSNDDNDDNGFWDTLYKPEMPPTSVIKADLEYISHTWSSPSFDLWEEIRGLHFFNLAGTLRALREGADFARRFGDDGAARWYTHQAQQVADALPRFWDAENGWLRATLPGGDGEGRDGLDCGTLLGALHGSGSGGEEEGGYALHSPQILATLLAMMRDMSARYPINRQNNHGASASSASTRLTATALGRYPSDIYTGTGTAPQGGNPWFLCTSTAAHISFSTAAHLVSEQKLDVTRVSRGFYSALLGLREDELDIGVYNGAGSNRVFDNAVEGLKRLGDEFLEIVRTHVDAEGSMSEQFDRHSGFMRGARDLSWSYGAFLGAVWARDEVV